MAAPDGNPVIENDRHRIFQYGKGKRAEKNHRHQQHPANDLSVLEEGAQLANHGIRLSRDDEFEILRHRRQQPRLVHHVRQGDQQQDQQRNQRQQGVIGDGASQQQALILAKSS